MNLVAWTRPNWRGLWRGQGRFAVLLCIFAAGLWCIGTFEYASFDILSGFRRSQPIPEVVLILMNEASYDELEQTRGMNWSRRLHAELLRKLHAAGARAVVFDVLFDKPGEPSADKELEVAMTNFGPVLVVSHVQWEIAVLPNNRLRKMTPFMPLEPFSRGGTGLANFPSDRDEMKRREPSEPGFLSIGCALAEKLELKSVSSCGKERWLRYYGANGIETRSYGDVLKHALEHTNSYVGKVAVIGHGWVTSPVGKDAELTPMGTMLGVELVATTCANALRDDWLHRMPTGIELGILIGTTLLALGSANTPGRGGWIAGAALGGGVITMEFMSRTWLNSWSNWLLPSMVAIAALGWRAIAGRILLARSRKKLTWPPEIPDLVLIRKIGEGAFGEAWLAKTVLDEYRVAKLIRRSRFPAERPFQREFEGVKRYAPVSMDDGLLRIYHAGKSDFEGYFYYLMEPADNSAGEGIDLNYLPKTLQSELMDRGFFPADECISLGITLAAALQRLHDVHRLVHRDIKPANIVFVQGKAKLADVGLVTPTPSAGAVATQLGTRGYIPPEGTGSRPADVFSLGKVLFEAAFGLDSEFPLVPRSVFDRDDRDRLMLLNEVVSRACEFNVQLRYQSAGELLGALRALQNSKITPS